MKLKTADKLLIVPHIWGKALRTRLEKESKDSRNLLNSRLFHFEGFSLLTGFLGYTHLLTLLGFIDGFFEKKIYFLGTAGIVNPELTAVQVVNATRIYSSAVFDSFPGPRVCELHRIASSETTAVSAVSVDIPQRETPAWLKQQVERGIDVVDMELYPLCHYFQKPLTGLLVTTDRVTERGVEIIPNKRRVREVFARAYELLVEESHEI